MRSNAKHCEARHPITFRNEVLIPHISNNVKPGTTIRLCTAEAGASVMMSEAMGSGFRIDEKFSDDVKNILLFAAGSGISPIKSAIESGSLGLSDSTTCTLYYGAKSPDLMAYMDK